ncbi:GNAT family N-acetyltransferase [Streptomyces sp. W1SF4]|uniref:GNAT family N-acetyltransferase n=1 Tax=Streptomyces sp. W1SF4 TaxID=2305220 RepID=UPI000F6F8B73|nr:GNAT family N-acetyltransferase [Streptomyces sp. W1SF4]AZM93772.1 GNAT family N-acetyltransferase [Streptomyces sp. W1SF4]
MGSTSVVPDLPHGQDDTAGAVHAWVRGWAVSRGAADPVPAPWGFTLDVGLPGHVARHVLTAADEAAVRKITENPAAPGTWLKAPAPPEEFESWLGPGWSLAGGPGFLMSAPPHAARAGARPAVADGYRLDTWIRDGVARALVRTAAGAFAARGQAGMAGPVFVVDQVETDPAHQRRGLGRLLMHALTDATAERGATQGVLVATPEGRALYETTGWRVVAPLTGAVRG